MILGANTLEEFGWRFFWDEQCVNPVKKGDFIPVEAGEPLDFYFACVPTTGVNADGTITKYDVETNADTNPASSYFYGEENTPSMGLCYVDELLNSIYIMGIDSDETNAIGQIEEVVVFSDNLNLNQIKNLQNSKKSTFGTDDDFFNTKDECYQAGAISIFDFQTTEALRFDLLTETATAVLNGDIIQVQGLNKPAMIVNENKEFFKIEPLRLEYDFAVNIKMKIDVGKSFTVLDIPSVVNIKYDYNNRTFEVTMFDYFEETQHSFRTESIGSLFGRAIDFAIVIIGNKLTLLLDGEEILVQNLGFTIDGINEYERANDVCEHKFQSLSGSNNPDIHTNIKRVPYGTKKEKLIENGEYALYAAYGGYTSNYRTSPLVSPILFNYTLKEMFDTRHDKVYHLKLRFKQDIGVVTRKLSPYFYIDPTKKTTITAVDVPV